MIDISITADVGSLFVIGGLCSRTSTPIWVIGLKGQHWIEKITTGAITRKIAGGQQGKNKQIIEGAAGI